MATSIIAGRESSRAAIPAPGISIDPETSFRVGWRQLWRQAIGCGQSLRKTAPENVKGYLDGRGDARIAHNILLYNTD